jgi:hypothetical protein
MVCMSTCLCRHDSGAACTARDGCPSVPHDVSGCTATLAALRAHGAAPSPSPAKTARRVGIYGVAQITWVVAGGRPSSLWISTTTGRVVAPAFGPATTGAANLTSVKRWQRARQEVAGEPTGTEDIKVSRPEHSAPPPVAIWPAGHVHSPPAQDNCVMAFTAISLITVPGSMASWFSAWADLATGAPASDRPSAVPTTSAPDLTQCRMVVALPRPAGVRRMAAVSTVMNEGW